LNLSLSKGVALVDLSGKLVTIDLISLDLFSVLDLGQELLLGLLGFSSSLDSVLKVDSFLEFLELLLFKLLLSSLFSFLLLFGKSLGVGFLYLSCDGFLELFLQESWQFVKVLFKLSELSLVKYFHACI
jgi:hypothetical protein